MERERPEALDATFAALADPTRRAIVRRLSGGETPLGRLAEPFDMSQTAVSKHVRVLEEAGLVAIEKRGRTRHCRLRTDALAEAFDWLGFYRAFWEDRLDALEDYLEELGDRD